MLNKLVIYKLLTQLRKPCLLLYLQQSSTPVLLSPYPLETPAWYQLVSKIRTHSNASNPLHLSSLNRAQLTIDNESVKDDPAISQANESMKVYLDGEGRIRESLNYENLMTPIGIVSERIGDRTIVGVQEKWEYFLAYLCKLGAFIFATSAFNQLYMSSRIEKADHQNMM